MLIVLAAEDQRHQLEVSDSGFAFNFADVLESAQPAGNGAGRQRFAVQRGHHSDHVNDFAAFAGWLGRNARDIELPLFKAEGQKAQLVDAGKVTVLVRHRYAEDLRLGDDQEGHGVNGRQRARRKNRPLNALLSALLDEGSKVGKVAESCVVPA